MGAAFKAIKQIAGMKTLQSAPTINKANAPPCDSPDEILQRWREHFEAALNRLPVFVHVLLPRIQPLIDLTRRPEQSGFVAGRSTIDAILALRLLSELHREFDRPLNVVYLDIKAAFDSVNRRALWKTLRSRGVPAILL